MQRRPAFAYVQLGQAGISKWVRQNQAAMTWGDVSASTRRQTSRSICISSKWERPFHLEAESDIPGFEPDQARFGSADPRRRNAGDEG
jgi:hypothetical protein